MCICDKWRRGWYIVCRHSPPSPFQNIWIRHCFRMTSNESWWAVLSISHTLFPGVIIHVGNVIPIREYGQRLCTRIFSDVRVTFPFDCEEWYAVRCSCVGVVSDPGRVNNMEVEFSKRDSLHVKHAVWIRGHNKRYDLYSANFSYTSRPGQWCRLQGARGHVPPTFTNGWHGGTVSRRTANKKLAKLYLPSRKRSPKRLIVLLEPKSRGARPKKNFRRFALDRWPPLSNAFQCHWSLLHNSDHDITLNTGFL